MYYRFVWTAVLQLTGIMHIKLPWKLLQLRLYLTGLQTWFVNQEQTPLLWVYVSCHNSKGPNTLQKFHKNVINRKPFSDWIWNQQIDAFCMHAQYLLLTLWSIKCSVSFTSTASLFTCGLQILHKWRKSIFVCDLLILHVLDFYCKFLIFRALLRTWLTQMHVLLTMSNQRQVNGLVSKSVRLWWSYSELIHI